MLPRAYRSLTPRGAAPLQHHGQRREARAVRGAVRCGAVRGAGRGAGGARGGARGGRCTDTEACGAPSRRLRGGGPHPAPPALTL